MTYKVHNSMLRVKSQNVMYPKSRHTHQTHIYICGQRGSSLSSIHSLLIDKTQLFVLLEQLAARVSPQL